jgi:hypothetical protein
LSKSKKVGLYFLALFLYVSIVGVPFADMQTCELPNGDKVKTRTSRNWYLLKGLNPHGSAWGRKTVKSWYVPTEWWKSNQELGYTVGGCKESQVFGKWIFISANGWFVIEKELIPKNFPKSFGDIFPALAIVSGQQRMPAEEQELQEAWDRDEAINNAGNECRYDRKANTNLSCTAYDVPRFGKSSDARDKIEARKLKQYGFDEGLRLSGDYFSGEYKNTLWSEVGFKKLSNLCSKEQADCPIAAVWQSHSADGGKTWSKPIITKDAKLFVIGKSIKDQPGVAKDKGTLRYIGWF